MRQMINIEFNNDEVHMTVDGVEYLKGKLMHYDANEHRQYIRIDNDAFNKCANLIAEMHKVYKVYKDKVDKLDWYQSIRGYWSFSSKPEDLIIVPISDFKYHDENSKSMREHVSHLTSIINDKDNEIKKLKERIEAYEDDDYYDYDAAYDYCDEDDDYDDVRYISYDEYKAKYGKVEYNSIIALQEENKKLKADLLGYIDGPFGKEIDRLLAVEKEFEVLKKENENLKKMNAGNSKAANKKQLTIENLQNHIKNLEKENEDLSSGMYKANISHLEECLADKNKVIKELTDKNNELDEECDTLKNDKADLARELGAAKLQNMNLRKDIEALREEKTNREVLGRNNEEVQERIAKLCRNSKTLEGIIKDRNAEIIKLLAQIEGKNDEIKDLNRIAREFEYKNDIAKQINSGMNLNTLFEHIMSVNEYVCTGNEKYPVRDKDGTIVGYKAVGEYIKGLLNDINSSHGTIKRLKKEYGYLGNMIRGYKQEIKSLQRSYDKQRVKYKEELDADKKIVKQLKEYIDSLEDSKE